MALRKKQTQVAAVAVSEWSVADLSALYSEQRAALTAQARRILKSDSDAVEIVQEAFLKFMLAAPELDSRERALAYLRTTVNNLCLNQIRATGARPNLVAIDSETSQERLDELAFQSHTPIDATLAQAEDAAIIREALSRLSADQRTALVMWEMEGRTTEEIADALGTTPANVRHVVARARQSFVRVLSTWVIDEANGTTALDALSTSYKKAAELAAKSSKVALSLILVLVAFLGFNSITGNEVRKVVPAISAPASQSVTTTPSAANSASPSSIPSAVATAAAQDAAAQAANDKAQSLLQSANAKIPNLSFQGLDANGLPTGFSAVDLNGHYGKAVIAKSQPIVSIDGTSYRSSVMSYDVNAINVLLAHTISITGAGTTIQTDPTVSIHGSWNALNVASENSDFVRLPDGNYLVTDTISIDSPVAASIIIPVSRGVDVAQTPTTIIARLILNPAKTQILAEAIQVEAKGVTN